MSAKTDEFKVNVLLKCSKHGFLTGFDEQEVAQYGSTQHAGANQRALIASHPQSTTDQQNLRFIRRIKIAT